MSDNELKDMNRTLKEIARWLQRIAETLERIAPPKVDEASQEVKSYLAKSYLAKSYLMWGTEGPDWLKNARIISLMPMFPNDNYLTTSNTPIDIDRTNL